MKVNQTSLCLLGALAINAGCPSLVVAVDEVVRVTNALTFAPTIPNKASLSTNVPEGMAWIPGGEFSMGCKVPSEGVCSMATMNAVDDAQPIHRVYVDGFWMDSTDVTSEEFAKFVKATGYVTVAERTPTKEEYPTAAPEDLVAGSPVFYSPAQARAFG